MKRPFPLSKFLAAAFVALAGVQFANGDDLGPASDVPELQALRHYVGVWDVALLAPESSSLKKGESTAKWILGGRFVEQSGVMISDDGTNRIEIKTLYTYDTTKRTYRSWTFVSSGEATEAEATWDAKARTMTSVTRPDADGMRAKIVADFSEPGFEKWKFIFTDRSGQQTTESIGKNTLRKK